MTWPSRCSRRSHDTSHRSSPPVVLHCICGSAFRWAIFTSCADACRVAFRKVIYRKRKNAGHAAYCWEGCGGGGG
ncbi:uncharacterized protein YALI1_D33191g [Yarrowia lipolytica]|uniref:Uncharacterized protein n=1 Tax=Yarrowia lipolytica TaxID=4952 RepID=A0A1D8NG44_YARLL|nr:hypothetical protein YALI1_D33191g [Yarrowia lipolytica]